MKVPSRPAGATQGASLVALASSGLFAAVTSIRATRMPSPDGTPKSTTCLLHDTAISFGPWRS